MRKHQTKAFTLVELIIVITILSILATIGFMSYQSYTLDARDSKRITDLKQVRNGLVIYKTKNINYPSHTPNTNANIGSLIIQGYVDNNILSKIKMSNETIDPLEKLPYTYSTNPDYTKYQLLTFLEKGDIIQLSSSLNKAYANDYNSRQEYVIGDKLGIVLDNSSSAPIQEIQTGTLDLAGAYAGTQFKLIVDNTNSGTITSTGNNLIDTITTETNTTNSQVSYDWYSSGSSWIFKDSNNNITYPTTCNNLITNSSAFYIAGSLTASGAGFKDGIYTIDPDGNGGNNPFDVYCDMTTDGGGWTLAYYSNNNITPSGNTYDGEVSLYSGNFFRLSFDQYKSILELNNTSKIAVEGYDIHDSNKKRWEIGTFNLSDYLFNDNNSYFKLNGNCSSKIKEPKYSIINGIKSPKGYRSSYYCHESSNSSIMQYGGYSNNRWYLGTSTKGVYIYNTENASKGAIYIN